MNLFAIKQRASPKAALRSVGGGNGPVAQTGAAGRSAHDGERQMTTAADKSTAAPKLHHRFASGSIR
jgi:hypothetical protein